MAALHIEYSKPTLLLLIYMHARSCELPIVNCSVLIQKIFSFGRQVDASHSMIKSQDMQKLLYCVYLYNIGALKLYLFGETRHSKGTKYRSLWDISFLLLIYWE